MGLRCRLREFGREWGLAALILPFFIGLTLLIFLPWAVHWVIVIVRLAMTILAGMYEDIRMPGNGDQ